MPAEYPEQYNKNVTLSDGTVIFLRPIKPSDDNLVLELFHSFSKETIYFRFFSTLKYMPKDQIEKMTHIDYEKQMAIVALLNDGGRERMVAVGRYTLEKESPETAEFAIVVQDSFQRKGIGTEVLKQLAHVAKLQGVRIITGYIMNENIRMFGALRKSGLKMTKRNWDRGVTRVDIPIEENVQIQ